jgi:small subunit ribosomal protein S1
MEATQDQPQSIADLQPKTRLQGVVKETQLYGAVVDVGLEHDGVVHISQLSPERVNRVSDVVQPGDSVTVWVTRVDAEKGHIALTMIEPPKVDWKELVEDLTYTGIVTRLESYGAFVDIGAERPGLLHVREMSDDYVRHPSQLVQIGQEIEVRVLKVDRRKKRIDLTMKGTEGEPELELEEEEAEEPAKTAMEIALELAQSGEQEPTRRHKKRSPLDLSEREDILARTLEKHSQR